MLLFEGLTLASPTVNVRKANSPHSDPHTPTLTLVPQAGFYMTCASS